MLPLAICFFPTLFFFRLPSISKSQKLSALLPASPLPEAGSQTMGYIILQQRAAVYKHSQPISFPHTSLHNSLYSSKRPFVVR